MSIDYGALQNWDMANATYQIADGGGIPDIQVIQQPTGDGAGGGTGGDGTPPPPASDPVADYYAWLKSQQESQWAAEKAAQREAASSWLTGVLKTYGLDSLAGSVSSLIEQWGTNYDVIGLKLKETEPYKVRFKGLLALQQKGVTDIRNESEYLSLETSYRQAFRENGLSDYLGTAGTQSEFDSIARLVGDYSVSVNEVRDRISDAQRAAVNTPDEVKAALRDYYGIDTGALVQWSLDPVKTMNDINRQVNAGLAGGMAAQQGLGIAASTAEQVANLYGNNDMDTGRIGQELVGAKDIADSTKRLAYIDNENLSNDEVVQTQFNTDANAKKKVGTLQSRERARFEGSSAFGTGSLSRNSGS